MIIWIRFISVIFWFWYYIWFWILYICSTVLSVLQRQKSVFQYFYWIFVDALQLSSYQYFSTLFRNSVFYFWNFEFPISISVLLSVQVFSILSFYLSVIQSHFICTLKVILSSSHRCSLMNTSVFLIMPLLILISTWIFLLLSVGSSALLNNVINLDIISLAIWHSITNQLAFTYWYFGIFRISSTFDIIPSDPTLALSNSL